MTASAEDRSARIERYAEGPRLLREALARVPSEALQWRPGPAKWSAHEIVCHCADSESHAALRIRTLLAGDAPTIHGYDQDAWASRLDYHSLPLDTALSTVDAVRGNTVPLLRRLTQEDFAKEGVHTESGPYSVDKWLEIYAGHLELHSRQIAANVEAWNARES